MLIVQILVVKLCQRIRTKVFKMPTKMITLEQNFLEGQEKITLEREFFC